MAAADVDFRPGAACGGQLNEEELALRSHACTEAALASLEASAEFKTWQRAKARDAARDAAAGPHPLVWLLLALLAIAGGAGVWRATRPVTHPGVTAVTSVPGDLWQPETIPEEVSAGVLLEEQAAVQEGLALLNLPPPDAATDAGPAAEPAQEEQRDAAPALPAQAEAEAEGQAAPDAEALLQAQLAAAQEESRRAAADAAAALAEAEAQRVAAAEASGQLEAAQAALEAARASTEDSSQLRQEVVRLQLELEEALAARQRADADASSAAESAESAVLMLRDAQAAQQAAERAAQAAAEREAQHADELAAVQAARAEAEAAAAQAAAERDAALQAAAAASAASVTSVELEAVQAAKRKAEAAAAAAMQREEALRAELAAAQRAAQQLAEAQEAAAAEGEANFASYSAQQAWHQLWQRQPEVVGAAAAGAACLLLATVAATAAVVRRRMARAAPVVASKQLARLQKQLEQAQAANDTQVAAFKKAQAAAEEAAASAAAGKQWEAAAAQLAAATADVPVAARVPLSARCSNHQGAGGSGATAPMVLPAGKADTPSAWLDLLQQRWAALSSAASKAGAGANEAAKGESRSDGEVSDVLTENELLKEQLADSKQACAAATAAEAAAKAAATGLQAELDSARHALAAAEAAGLEACASVEAELAAVVQERDELAQEVSELRRQLAEREGELAVLRDDVPELERENSNLEAQMDQVTQALMEVQAQKSQLERRVAELEQDVSSLGILAQKLEGDKAVLERQLAEAREAQAELCLASQQYIAADSAIKSIQASEDTELRSTGVQDDLLRRAVEDKALALDLLASAERKLVDSHADSEASSPYPVHHLLLSGGRRLSGLASLDSGHSTPLSRSARVASYLGSKMGSVVKMLSTNGDGSEAASTPTSAMSASGMAGGAAGGTPQNIGAWLNRTQELFSSAEHLLGQELRGQAAGAAQGTPPYAPASFPLPSLPDSARQREQHAALEAALEHSSAEVKDLLAALELAATIRGNCGSSGDADAAKGGDDSEQHDSAAAAVEAAVAAARGALAAAHERVADAAQRMRGSAAEVEGLKRRHGRLRDEVAEQEHAVDAAQARVEAAFQSRAASGSDDEAQAAGHALAAAEEELEATVDKLCQLENCIRAAMRDRAAAHDALLREQAALAAVVQDAADALERHAALTEGTHATPALASAAPALSPTRSACAASPGLSGGLGFSPVAGAGPSTAVRGLRAAEAEAAAVSELLEAAWYQQRGAAGPSGSGDGGLVGAGLELDRGERAASSKDDAEEQEDGLEVEGPGAL